MSEFFPAADKKFIETIIMVPFFDGSAKALKRHIELLNKSGFDVVFVDLNFEHQPFNPPISSQLKFGMKHVWADHIESVLNNTKGMKIIFSFSNPTVAALEAVARRRALDIKAFICDSGPSAHLTKSIYNLFTEKAPSSFLPFRFVKAIYSTLWFAPQMEAELKEELALFPNGFPLLSIRGWRDKLISPMQIDKIFEPHQQIHWQKLNLPEAEHLNGLRDFPEEYSTGILRFLQDHACSL